MKYEINITNVRQIIVGFRQSIALSLFQTLCMGSSLDEGGRSRKVVCDNWANQKTND